MDLQKKNIYWSLYLLKGISHFNIKKIFLRYFFNIKYNYNKSIDLFNKKRTNFKELKYYKKNLTKKLKIYKKIYNKKIKKYLRWKIKKLIKIKHYKSYRYKKHLPLNGQRTKTNSRTTRRLKNF